MKLGLPSVLLVSACATTAPTIETREVGPRAKVEIDLSTTSEERAVFPQVAEPRLPSVDRIAHHVRARLGDRAIAAVELCVAPDGHVTRVALLESSTDATFDAALLHDARAWQFASLPGVTARQALQTCERATVKYHVP